MLFNTFRKNSGISQQTSQRLDFKSLLDNLTTAIMLVDDELRVIHLNTACEHFFSVSLGQVGDRLLQISRDEAMLASQETTRNLVRGLAHEVKNPLGGIRGAAQLLDREFDNESKNSEFKEYTHVIISEADRLRNLVDRMLGPRDLTPFVGLSVHEVFERVLSIIKAETHGEIEIKRDYDPSIPELNGDVELLIQAFLNVARNAVQALKSQSDNTAPRITFRTNIQRQFTIGRSHFPLVCCATITDNGPGIPPNIIKDIFYPMISGRAEGTGLGLAISQQLINQHNGLIECTSQPGNTEFAIYIPIGITP